MSNGGGGNEWYDSREDCVMVAKWRPEQLRLLDDVLASFSDKYPRDRAFSEIVKMMEIDPQTYEANWKDRSLDAVARSWLGRGMLQHIVRTWERDRDQFPREYQKQLLEMVTRALESTPEISPPSASSSDEGSLSS